MAQMTFVVSELESNRTRLERDWKMRSQTMKENFDKLCCGFGTIFTAVLQRNWSILFQVV